MILGIETSTTQASLAVFDTAGGSVVWNEEFTTDRSHNAVIFEPVSEVLRQYRDGLSGIAVGVGPGSYSGVRVGIAVANGLSMTLGIPCCGFSSLEAWEVDEDTYAVLGDARRKTIFVANVKERQVQGDPELVGEDDIEECLSSMSNEGVPLYSADRKVVESFEKVSLELPSASRLAWKASMTDPSQWPKRPLEPHYLRAPYFTTPKKKGPLS